MSKVFTPRPSGKPHSRAHSRGFARGRRYRGNGGGAASRHSRGGMRTKIEAAKIATAGGTHMIITDGRVEHPVSRLNEGAPCTWFLTARTPSPRGKNGLRLARTARRLACRCGRSASDRQWQKPVACGVTRVEGSFTSGDCVLIRDFALPRSGAVSWPMMRATRS